MAFLENRQRGEIIATTRCCNYNLALLLLPCAADSMYDYYCALAAAFGRFQMKKKLQHTTQFQLQNTIFLSN